MILTYKMIITWTLLMTNYIKVIAKHHYKNCSVIFLLLPMMLIIKTPTVYSQTVNDLVLLTEPYPPYNYESKGELKGVSVDLMVKMLENIGSKLSRRDIVVVPWAYAYEQAKTRKNVALFVMTRSKHREKIFKWVGPITNTIIGITAKKSRKIQINKFSDLKKYRIGVIRSDIAHQLLVKNGFPKEMLLEVRNTEQNIRLLNIDRIDLWGYDTNVAFWELKAHGFDTKDYEKVFILERGELWYAFNLQTHDSVITALQKSYNELKANGIYKKILDKYLNISNAK